MNTAARTALGAAVWLALTAATGATWAAQTSQASQAAHTCPFPDTPPTPGSTPESTAAAAGPVQARWTTEPASVPVGEPFVMVVSLCPATAQLVGVDASMPDHRHGMNYQPSFQPTGSGQWRVEGMVWHMSGRWELRLDTTLAGVPHRLTQSVMLK